MAESFETLHEPNFTLGLPLCKKTSYWGEPFDLQDSKTQMKSSVFEGLE